MANEPRGGTTGEELAELSRELFPGGAMHFHSLPEGVASIFARGQGSRMWDIDGKEYIDFVMGSGPMILGHAHPAVTEAVKKRLDSGSQIYQISEATLHLAKKVVEATPCAQKIKFVNSGNEATYLALRVARAYTGKTKVLKFEGGFHGSHDYAAWSIAPKQALDFPQAEVDTSGIPEALNEHVLIAPFNDTEYVCSLIRQHKEELAAVIVEPLHRTVPPKPGFLDAVREVTRECGVLLVFDEVVTGFRLAWGGGQEFYGVTPDLATLGKAIGGGFPVGALVGAEEPMSCLDPASQAQGRYVMSSGTFSGNPITSTAGLATLTELEKPGSYERLHSSGQRLRDGFSRVCEMLETPVRAMGEGPVVDFMFIDHDVYDYRSGLSADHALAHRVSVEMMKRGILRPPGSKFYVSLAHSDEDLDETINVFESSLRAAR